MKFLFNFIIGILIGFGGSAFDVSNLITLLATWQVRNAERLMAQVRGWHNWE